jgi:hypothetical protein
MALLLVVPNALAQEQVRGSAATEAPVYYLFQTAQLSPDGPITAEFQYRIDDLVVGTDRAMVTFGAAESRLVPFPDSLSNRALLRGDEDLRVLVFANGALLADLDREQLLAYNRTLAYTQVSERDLRSFGTKIECNSPCSGGCGPYDDYDCDGVANYTDNCIDDANSNQADCDNDGYGDVCDTVDGTYQTSGGVDTCMTDKDHHVYKVTWEHHVEQRLVDTSSCNSPDQWNRWVRDDADCGINDGNYGCCLNLTLSIAAVGDDPNYWCSTGVRDNDYCH